MVDTPATPPLPWLDAPLRAALGLQNSHALLVHGPQGVGQFELALALAQAQLCEARPASARDGLACGRCAACRLFAARTHPDLLVLMPQAQRIALAWGGAEGGGDDDAATGSARTKPSKEIRIDDVRGAISFAQATSSRGRGKVVLVYPAERMNPQASNALLKTLEEPAGDTRFVLASSAPDALLPTVRSRCQAVALALPDVAVARIWLAEQGVADPAVLLDACGGQPLEAAQWARDGIDAALWRSIPKRVARAEADAFAEWPLARVVDTLQKLCHDALCTMAGAPPRYFPSDALAPAAGLVALTEWAAQLRLHALHCEHPWNAGLKLESLLAQAKSALDGDDRAAPRARGERPFVHSAP